MESKRPFKLLFLLLIFVPSAILFAQENKGGSSSKREASGEVKPERTSSNIGGGLSADPIDPSKQSAIEEIKAQLATMATKQLMALIEFCKKNQIVGDFVVDLTVEGKGKIVTVFMVSTPEIPIPKKNLLKNRLSELHFDNIKLSKKQRVKFRYTFKF